MTYSSLFAAGPREIIKDEFSECEEYKYHAPEVERLSKFNKTVAYFCIDGFVFLRGSTSHGPLAQIIIHDKDGLPVPLVCPKHKKED